MMLTTKEIMIVEFRRKYNNNNNNCYKFCFLLLLSLSQEKKISIEILIYIETKKHEDTTYRAYLAEEFKINARTKPIGNARK